MLRRSPFLATLRACLLITGSIVAIGFALPGFAQDVPPVYPAIDANGVNVSTGRFVYSQTDVVIGQPGSGGLAYTRYDETGTSGIAPIQTDNQTGYIVGSGLYCTLVLGFQTELFSSTADLCQGTNTSEQANGSTLTYNAGTQVYTFTESDGTAATFGTPAVCGASCEVVIRGMNTPTAYLSSITKPDGEVIDYSYEFGAPTCYPQPDTLPCNDPLFVYGRLVRVDTSLGYRLNLIFNAAPKYMMPPVSVVGVNAAVENCLGSSCSDPWPTATYTLDGNGNVTSVTDGLGAQTIYNFSGLQLTGIQFPDNSAHHQINLTYKPSSSGTFFGFVDTVDKGFGTWTYNYADDGNGGRTTTVTNPDSTSTTHSYQLTIATGRINTVTDELGHKLNYTYDANNRRTKVTEPEGNYTQYTYDSRGNITENRQVAKPGSGLADIVTTATFPSSCSNPVTCNKPTATTDALGNKTDYTYDPTHGGVTQVVAPPAITGGARLTTTYNYTQYQAYYMDSGGNWIYGTPVWRLTSTSACATASTCAGTANETVTTIAYASTPNNVLPSSITKAAGDNSVSATTSLTYTNWGDVSTVQGPLGSTDTTRYYYDNDRRVTGIAGPDPDGSGAYRAVKTSYNEIGEPTVVERGTVPSQGDSAFSSFTSLEKQDTAYDEYGRRQYSRLWDGSTIIALTQYNYDNRGRPLCTAVRMNPASFASPPSDACTPYGGGGEDDRITHIVYDGAGRVLQRQSAYGTTLEQTTATFYYTDNGKVQWQEDAKYNRTTYYYDGLDRLSQRRYPDPNNPHQSSTTDYEQYFYNSVGELNSETLRNGDPVTFMYDNLGRVTSRTAGSEASVTYGYDLFGRLTSASQSGETVTDTYDALSRLTSEESVISGQFDDTVGYHYDAAGHRTEMDYPGGFYVTYSYDNAGDLTDIRENGAVRLATYSYDGLGRRTKLQRLPDANPTGAVTSYAYDPISRLANLTQDASGTSYDTSITFGYNAASQIVSRTDTNPTYDPAIATTSSDSYAANGQNRYTSALGTTPSYNPLGDLKSDGTNTYYYDDENRLTSATGGVALDYDPMGGLRDVSGSSSTRFVYDGDQVIATYDSSGNVLQRYVYGPGTDDPLVRYEGSGTSNRSWFLADERGSVIGITDDAGNVTQVDKYDAYGEPDASNQGRFQYTGQMWIPDLGVYYYKAREYHPKLGRFMQTDPIGYAGGMNLYGYAGNDPVNMIDPSGLCDAMSMLATFHVQPWMTTAEGAGGTSMSGTYTWYTFSCPPEEPPGAYGCDSANSCPGPQPAGGTGGGAGGTGGVYGQSKPGALPPSPQFAAGPCAATGGTGSACHTGQQSGSDRSSSLTPFTRLPAVTISPFEYFYSKSELKTLPAYIRAFIRGLLMYARLKAHDMGPVRPDTPTPGEQTIQQPYNGYTLPGDGLPVEGAPDFILLE